MGLRQVHDPLRDPGVTTMSTLLEHWYVAVATALGAVVIVLIWKWNAIHQRIGIWGTVGTVLGWMFILLGLIGGLVPLIPGFPMGILGLLLLGPNDPFIRRIWLRLHHFARHCVVSAHPRRQRFGRWILDHEDRVARPWLEEEQALHESVSHQAPMPPGPESLRGSIEGGGPRDDG